MTSLQKAEADGGRWRHVLLLHLVALPAPSSHLRLTKVGNSGGGWGPLGEGILVTHSCPSSALRSNCLMTPPSHKMRKGRLFHQTSYSTEGRFVKWADKHLKRTTDSYSHQVLASHPPHTPLPVPACDGCRSQEMQIPGDKVPRKKLQEHLGDPGGQVNLLQAWEAAVPHSGVGTTHSFSDSMTMCQH